ncbi:hypothetical protein QQ045_013440 [Rhodiola kirilowii]
MTSPPTLDQDQNFDAVSIIFSGSQSVVASRCLAYCTSGLDLDIETVDSNSTVSDTPGGTRYWTPQCLEDKRPFLGQKFDSLNGAITFYNDYASVCGFSVRLGTEKKSKDGTVRLKQLVCHKQGFYRNENAATVDTLNDSNAKERNRAVTRCGCHARMNVRLVDGLKFAVYSFEERHNHYLASTVGQKFLRINRCLTYDQQDLLVCCSNVNVGASSAFRIMKEMVGGKKDFCKGFVFEFFADTEGTLCRLFWADPRSVSDSKVFGDVVSFDATYGSNKYNMVFVPFTGIDNHKSSVTLAAGLISNKDVESYSWLLECFKKSIGKKLKAKVGVSLSRDTNFIKDISSAIWTDHMCQDDFEEQWNSVIVKYHLEERDVVLNKDPM